ncbi:hypothetical protein C6P42_003623, partial [Pichia californica]
MLSLVKTVFLGLLAQAMASTTVEIEGTTYESFGLVGFGRIPADSVDKYGETVAPGSSIQVEKSSVTVDSNGVYHFIAWGLPDRGMNINGTVNTFSRIHKYNVDFTPANSSSTDNIIWTLEDTVLLTDFNGDYFSGLDSNTTVEFNGLPVPAVVYHGDGWGSNLNSSKTITRLSLDSESLTFIDGSIDNGFWIGDEYGPSLIKFDSNGKMIDYIEAPDALLPHVNGKLFFSSDDNYYFDQSYSVTENENGRYSNHGYEGMDITPDGKYLFTLLQSATVQDGGDKAKSRYNSRLLKYDLTSSSSPTLVGEYVVVLPTYEVDKVKTAAQSEMRVISEDLIMILPRDSHLGRGGTDGTTSVVKHVDLYSLTDASNIVGLYDGVGGQVSTSKGVLDSSITPATYYSFIDIIDPTELAKFGLHNGDPNNDHLLNEKWEGMDLFPVQCTTDEYFLILISDSDYQTTDGFMNFGKITYDSGINVDTQNLMFHIKLPLLTHSNVCTSSPSSSAASSSAGSSSVTKSSTISSVSSSSEVTSSPVVSSQSSSSSSEVSSITSSVQSSITSSSSSSSLSESLTTSSTSSSVIPSSSSSIDLIEDISAEWSNGPVFNIIFQHANAIDSLDTTVVSSHGIISNDDSFGLYDSEDKINFHRGSFESSSNGISMTEKTDESFMKLNYTGNYDASSPYFEAEFEIVYDIDLNNLKKRDTETTTVTFSLNNPSYTSGIASASSSSVSASTTDSSFTSTGSSTTSTGSSSSSSSSSAIIRPY